MSARCQAICLAIALVVGGARARADEDAQLWLATVGEVRIGDDLRVANETVARFSDSRHGLYEIENNLLLGRRVSRDVTLWAGYTLDPLFARGRLAQTEHRAREQVTVDNLLNLGPASLSGRLRLEQRWRENLPGTGWRMRPFVRLTLPIANGGRTTANLSHESFINLDRTVFQSRRGFERMRNAILIRTPLANSLALEFGYLNQLGFVSGARDHSDHVATISVTLSR